MYRRAPRLAGAQTKVSGTGKCSAKPEVQQSAEVGDRAGHVLVLTKQACTWTTPIEMAGLKIEDVHRRRSRATRRAASPRTGATWSSRWRTATRRSCASRDVDLGQRRRADLGRRHVELCGRDRKAQRAERERHIQGQGRGRRLRGPDRRRILAAAPRNSRYFFGFCSFSLSGGRSVLSKLMLASDENFRYPLNVTSFHD